MSPKPRAGKRATHLYVAQDQSYVAQKDCDAASQSFRRLSIMISNLIDYLKRSSLKGPKYTASNQAKNATP